MSPSPATIFALVASCVMQLPHVAHAADSPAGPAPDRAGYTFAAGKSTAIAVRLEKEGTGLAFSWPAEAGAGHDTVLLALRVDSDNGTDPSIEVATQSQRVRHYLDNGAHGLRWLNLSHLNPAPRPGDRIALAGQGVRLDGQGAELRLFDNHLDLGARILVIAPHPDDAEIAAFGLYAGRHSAVVTVTAGNAGDANYAAEEPDQVRQYELKGKLRAYDSVTVPWLGGVPPQRTANLGYFDARLDAMYGAPAEVVPELYGPNTDVARYRIYNQSPYVSGATRANSWQHLVEDLVAVLRQVNPDIIVMPDPRLDSHHDHEFAAVALVQALDRWGGSPRFLLYTNHADENLYPYGPRGSPVSLPPTHGPVAVASVFSLATPPQLQTRKLFALEAMHDLRPSPDEQVRGETDPAHWRPDYPRRAEVDYFRRGPRANELFLAFDSPGARAVIREFLAGYREQGR